MSKRAGFACCPEACPGAYSPAVYNDLTLAHYLLHGFMEEDRRGVPHWKFFDREGIDEKEARRALARLLRSDQPIQHELRVMLARLVDPDDYQWAPGNALAAARAGAMEAYCADDLAQHQKIKLGFRGREQRWPLGKKSFLEREVAQRVKGGATVEGAIGEVAEKFGVSEGIVKKYWDDLAWIRGKRGSSLMVYFEQL
jgi:hypothetical protein